LTEAAPQGAAGPTAAEVLAYLRQNPRFLVDHPELYRLLAVPIRVHGDILADHMAAMLRAERTHAVSMAARADDVLEAGRAAAGLTARVHEAVLALIGAASPAECITAELPVLLAVDAASLCAEGDAIPGARPLPPGSVARLLGTRAVVFRREGSDAVLLHGEAAGLARNEALLRVPGEGPPALVALVARDSLALDPNQGTGALGFLARAVAATLGR
jgi:uncharacterized protein